MTISQLQAADFAQAIEFNADYQKLNVSDQGIEVRHAHQTLGGKLVSWLKLHTIGDRQKADDQFAFRMALRNSYGETLGAAAYKHACNACALTDGKDHSLSVMQVRTALEFADAEKTTRSDLALAYHNEVGWKENPPNLQQRQEIAAAKAQLPYTIEIMNDAGTELAKAAHDYTIANSTKTDRDLINVFENDLFDMVEVKFGSEIAEAVLKEAREDDWVVKCFEHPTTKATRAKTYNAQALMTQTGLQAAVALFMKTLPQNVQDAIWDVSRLVKGASPEQLSQMFGLPEADWDSVDDQLYAEVSQMITHQVIQRCADLASSGQSEKLAKLDRDSFDDLIIETLKDVMPEEDYRKQRAGHIEVTSIPDNDALLKSSLKTEASDKKKTVQFE